VKFSFIKAEKVNHKVATLCRVLEVSRSGYYAWQQRPPSKTSKHREELWRKIESVFKEHKSRYGSVRIARELRAAGDKCNRTFVARLMQAHALRAIHTKRHRLPSKQSTYAEASPNLLERAFTVQKANRAWVGDMTFIETQQGWLYLAVLIDLFSRKVVGFASSSKPDVNVSLSALKQALSRRDISGDLLHHTDQGSIYMSTAYRDCLSNAGVRQSMSRRGNCWDNAVAESFFKTLKIELVYRTHFKTHDEAKLALFEYIEGYYNRKRRHSHLNYTAPVAFENAMAA
jgi:transposase InsO family protein